MPLEMMDPDGDDADPSGGARFRGPRRPWWRPASTAGRVLLGVGVLVVLGGVATAAFAFKTYIVRDARFRIAGGRNIQATGLTEVSRAEMLPVFGEDIGRNIFFVPLAERRKQLEEIPWIERATVMRLLPDQIRVTVVERQPAAFTRLGRQVGLVDASGVLLAMPAAMMAQHHYSFPVVTGIDPRDPLASRKARMATYARLLAELDAGNQHLSEQVSEIDLTDPEDARVLMPEQGADILAHFGEDHFMERYQRYKAHIAEWRQQYPRLAAVDLRYEQQVVLQMQPGAGAVATSLDDAAASRTASSTAPSPDQAKPSPAQPGVHTQAEARPGLSGDTSSGKANIGKPNSGKLVSGKLAPAKPAAAVKTVRTGATPAGNALSPPHNSAARQKAAKDKAARDKKKRADAKRAALNASKRKPAPTHPAAAAAQSQ
jgi:cell division protein FtsQ